MRKLYLTLFLTLACIDITLAQEKSKSLTMDDVSPSQTSTTPSSADTSKTTSKTSKTSKNPSNDPLENIWQDRMNEAELKVLTAELRSALASRSSESVIELNRQRQFMAELANEGSKKNYKADKSLEVTYRERYVKLRIEMMDEARIDPSASETQLLYTDAKKSRKKKLKTPRGQNIPNLDTKAVKVHQTKMDKMIAKMEDLVEEGRRAGVAAKIFED